MHFNLYNKYEIKVTLMSNKNIYRFTETIFTSSDESPEQNIMTMSLQNHRISIEVSESVMDENSVTPRVHFHFCQIQVIQH